MDRRVAGWARRVATGGVVAVALAAGPASAGAQTPAACKAVKGSTCGTLTVPLDHRGVVPGEQRLGYVVLPATGAKRGTLAVLAGGPGEAATSYAAVFAKLLAPVRKAYDILLVDQRGVGLSGRLSCPGLASSESLSAVAACGKRLGIAREFLTTHEDAQDLHDVQVALGITKLSVYAVSSGTGVAGQYARLFPEAVERLLLDSPVPIEGADALQRLRSLALPRVLREICFPAGCGRGLGARPEASLGTLAARLADTPLRGRVVLPSGKTREARLTQAGLAALIAATDSSPALRLQLPSVVASALRGDAAPILRLIGTRSSEEGDTETGGVNLPRLLATDCIESRLPWDPASAVTTRPDALKAYLAAAPAAAFAPFTRTVAAAQGITALCLEWPETPKPEGVGPTGPAVPVLVISGRDDLRTPLEDARRTASQYPNAAVLAVPGTGHSVLTSDLTPCTLAATVAFLTDKPVEKCTRKAATIAPAPYLPAELTALPVAPGAKGLPGRAATAVLATLKDASNALTSPGSSTTTTTAITLGGLRAGTLRITKTGIALSGYSVVRGVTLTGTIGLKTKQDTFAVGGRVSGTVTLTKTKLTGTLGGQPIDVTEDET